MKCVQVTSLFLTLLALGAVGCNSGSSPSGTPPLRTVDFNDYGADPCAPAVPDTGLTAGPQDAGIYFSDGSDGEFRGRAENVLNIELNPSNFTPPGDTGVDFRGLGGRSSVVNLDDITNGLEDASSTGFSNRRKPKSAARTWKRSTLVPHASRLSIGDKEHLPLEAMAAQVRIDGFRARVVLDYFYRNDRETQLEGNFQLRLPHGAAPDYLAFGRMKIETPVFPVAASTAIADIRTSRAPTWEAPREARVVPREKAAHAYADVVRQAIDPALLEWAGADVFSARVFPLAPGKLHRIVVGYDVDLRQVGSDLVFRLDLPAGVPQVDVDLSVAAPDAVVQPEATPREGRYHWRNPATNAIAVRLPAPGTLLLRGDDPRIGGHFAARFRPPLPDVASRGTSRALFLVDTSLSSNPDAMHVWLRLVEAVLEANRAELREFAVAFFNVETFLWRPGFQPNTPENVAALLAYAGGLTLEGATDLGQALTATAKLGGDYDMFLMSDGAVTWGEGDVYALSRALPTGHALFGYATGASGTDRHTLTHLAHASGGAVFTVAGASAVAAAATAHRKRPWKLVDVRVEGGRDLLLAGRPTTIFPGQTLALVGRGKPAKDASLHLTVEQDGTRHTLRTPVDRQVASPLAARAYAQVAVGQLEGARTLGDLARAYATHYRIVGPTCSLLMLESPSEYEKYGIVPEDDAKTIRTLAASEVVAAAHREHGASLGDPKLRFQRWLQRLAAMKHVTVTLPAEVVRAMDAMPTAAFAVAPDALPCRMRTARALSPALRAALAKRTFSYDDLMAEAHRRNAAHGAPDALRALSSLVEHQPGDLVLARDVAFTALSWGLRGQAYHLLRRVVERRPHEIATYYALALALQELGKIDLAMLHFEVAMLAGAKVKDFSLIVAFEYLRMLRRIERGDLTTSVPDFARARLAEIAKLPKVKTADLVIVMAWNTDRTDVDLHVEDPNGEVCNYQHTDTKIGGHITNDITTGFGPEMFVLRNAIPGDYAAEAHYYSSDTTRTSARSKVYVTIYEDWGRPNERVTRKTVTLTKKDKREQIVALRRK